MRLIVTGSSSQGNGYVIQAQDGEALLLEAGMPYRDTLQAMDFDAAGIAGCLITHEHGDHAAHAAELLDAAVPVFCSGGTAQAIAAAHRLRRKPHTVRAGELARIGGFIVMPFRTEHDAAEPLGYVIQHPEAGNILFATDTAFLPYRFSEITTALIEANYSLDLLGDDLPAKVRSRIVRSHMSLQEAERTALDLGDTLRHVVLIHLSASHSDARRFTAEMRRSVPQATVDVAEPGAVIDISREPF